MFRSVVRRPLFSAAAALAVLGGSGAAYLAGSPSAEPQIAEAAFTAPVPLSAAEQSEVAAQAAADAADQSFHDASDDRVAAQQAATQAAQEAARVAAEAAAAAEAARVATREQAARDAQRDPRAIAEILVSEAGWSSEQFGCLDSLWTKESNWRWNADNPTSSAYGIPQALPGSKMSTFGEDWATNPLTQIEWGLSYIESRYGTPCSAWAHSRSNNWY